MGTSDRDKTRRRRDAGSRAGDAARTRGRIAEVVMCLVNVKRKRFSSRRPRGEQWRHPEADVVLACSLAGLVGRSSRRNEFRVRAKRRRHVCWRFNLVTRVPSIGRAPRPHSTPAGRGRVRFRGARLFFGCAPPCPRRRSARPGATWSPPPCSRGSSPRTSAGTSTMARRCTSASPPGRTPRNRIATRSRRGSRSWTATARRTTRSRSACSARARARTSCSARWRGRCYERTWTPTTRSPRSYSRTGRPARARPTP